jgi:hypothetical protein
MFPAIQTCDHALELLRLRREVGRLKRVLFAALMLALALPLLSARLLQGPEVLRVKGLVVVDEAGRERILIGAPVPHAANRVREDLERAKAAWGQRFGQFDWYATLDHGTNGLLILDENGHDRIALGDPVPDPTLGRRIAPGTGLTLNDQNGDERSGWGYFQALDRVGFGLDHPGGEGLNLFVLEDGTSGLLARSRDGERGAFLGVANGGSFATGLDAALDGLLVRDATGPRLLAGNTGGKPGIELRDEQGQTALRLPE